MESGSRRRSKIRPHPLSLDTIRPTAHLVTGVRCHRVGAFTTGDQKRLSRPPTIVRLAACLADFRHACPAMVQQVVGVAGQHPA